MSLPQRNRWDVVVAYAALAAATQVLWLTFAPITSATAEHYGVSEGAVGWLAEVFPLLYVVLALPAGMALDRWFGTFVGLLLGLLLGPALGSAADLRALLVIEAALGVLAATALWIALRARPAGAAALERAIGLRELRAVWGDRFVRALCALAFAGFGVFIALTTWLQPLLEPFGVSDGTAGAMLVAAVLAGVAMTTWLPAAAARNGAERSVLAAALGVCGVCCAVLAGVRAPAAQFVLVAAIGAVVLPALPVLLELAERRAGSAGASAAALVWLAGNLGGIALALPVGALVDHAAPAFGLLALAALAGLPFAWRLGGLSGQLELGTAAAEARE